MPAPSTDRDQAEAEIAAVEAALREGHPPRSLIGSHVKTALRITADRLGVDAQSLRHRIGTPDCPGAYFRRYSLAVDWSVFVPPPRPIPTEPEPKLAAPQPVPDRKTTRLQDEVNRLRKALKDAHRGADIADLVREALGTVVDTPRELPSWAIKLGERERGKPTPEVPVTCWSDWHLGEVVEPAEVNGFNRYSMTVAEERVQRLVETTIKLCRHNHTGNYPGIVINLAGDTVSGGLHPELKATDEEETIPASIKAVDWIAGALHRMADEFGHVYVPAVAGNHGRNTAKPEFKRYYRKNFDWLIYQMLIRHFADDARIQFDVRPSNDVFFRVFNERYLLQHGDMLGVRGGDGIIGPLGPITRGEVKKSGQSSALGFGFDKLILGHWHQRLWLPRAIVSNTLKGFDEYAKNQLGAKPDRPTQPLWFVHPSHGQTSHWDIYVDDPPAPAREWVAVLGATA